MHLAVYIGKLYADVSAKMRLESGQHTARAHRKPHLRARTESPLEVQSAVGEQLDTMRIETSRPLDQRDSVTASLALVQAHLLFVWVKVEVVLLGYLLDEATRLLILPQGRLRTYFSCVANPVPSHHS
jgi:hypothetical protein